MVIIETVLALIGLFYVLDVDYPKAYELGLNNDTQPSVS